MEVARFQGPHLPAPADRSAGRHMNVFQMPIGRYAPGIVNVVIEVPKGSRKRYRYHRKRRAFVVDYRLMISAPGEYGWVPQTWTKGGKRLNAIVLVRKPTWAGNVCEARPVGALRRQDGDHQVVCALLGETRFESLRDIADLDAGTMRRLVQFYEPFFPLDGWMNREEALELLSEASKTYRVRAHKLEASGRGEDLPTDVEDDDHYAEDEDDGSDEDDEDEESSQVDDDVALPAPQVDEEGDSERPSPQPPPTPEEHAEPAPVQQEATASQKTEEHDA